MSAMLEDEVFCFVHTLTTVWKLQFNFSQFNIIYSRLPRPHAPTNSSQSHIEQVCNGIAVKVQM